MMRENLICLYTIARRETTRIFRIWVQTLVPPVITMTLYFIVFGSFIGSQLSGIKGFEYMAFIAPGLIMMSIITNSYTNTVSSFFSTKFQKNIEEMLVSPTPEWVIVLGYISGGVIRGLSVGLLVSLVSLIFIRLPMHSLVYTVLFAFLTSFVFALAGMINGIFAQKFDDISIIPTFVITPLTYLGGVFYSISRKRKSGSRSTASRAAITRTSRSVGECTNPCASRPSAMICPTESRGLKLPYGS